jgi:F0F1-type ATP synthase assembly protein I
MDSVSIPPSATRAEIFARVIRQAAPILAASWTMIAAVALGAVGGYWLDGRWGTRPWIAVTGTVLGTAVGMYELARVALRGGREPRR